MIAAEVAAHNLTTPVLSQTYKTRKFDKPPSVEDIIRTLLPIGSRSSTAPIPLTCATYMILSINGKAQIVLPRAEEVGHKAGIETTRNKIDLIKSKFALSVIQVAELFNVTRKAVYDWYDGAEPKSATAARINIVKGLDRELFPPDTDLAQLKLFWKIPVSGTSFLSLLSNDLLGDAELRVALIDKINELSPRMGTKNASAIRLSKGLPASQLADIERAGDFS